jgi:hypothetical protein
MALTLARTHDVSEVFDPEYQPKDTLESEFFEQKQSFVYSVFNKCILTDIGKTLVRLHEKTFDAQAVYKGLVENAKNSTAASLPISKLIEYLTTAKLDSRWHGSSTSFILNWRDRMQIYEALTLLDEHHNDGLKKRMLEAAVLSLVMFGDNQSVITNSTIPHSKLSKLHVALSYHRVREAIAGKIVIFHHIDGKINPADMPSKHAGYQQLCHMLRTLLFWGVNYKDVPESYLVLIKFLFVVVHFLRYSNYYYMVYDRIMRSGLYIYV